MKTIATVTGKGQITIPQKVRERLGLEQGDRIVFEIENGVVVRPYREEANPFEAYAGVLGAFETRDAVNAWLTELRE